MYSRIQEQDLLGQDPEIRRLWQRSIRGLLIVFGAVALWACDSAPQPDQVLISNVHIVDPVEGLVPDQQVLIEAGQIISVENSGAELPANPNRKVRDAAGQFLTPGLWDMHVHFVFDPALTNEMADLFLDYGITSVRDTGGDIDALAALRAQLPTPKPNIYISGPLLDGQFVVYDGTDASRPELGTPVLRPEDADATVAALQQAGADFIKIYELIRPDTYAALVAAANARNMPIASHVPLMMTADTAGPLAGSMEHLRNIELACARNWTELLEERQRRITNFTEGLGHSLRAGLHNDQRLPAIAAYDEQRCNTVLDTLTNTIQVPTLRLNTVRHLKPFLREDWPEAFATLPEATKESWTNLINLFENMPASDPAFSEWSVFLIERLLARGVPIGAGTDTPIGLGIPGYSLHTELELLVSGGMTPQQALFAATVTPARFHDLQDDVGQIKPGMRADLLLLQNNPLTDIRHTRGIEAVMLAGQWVR